MNEWMEWNQTRFLLFITSSAGRMNPPLALTFLVLLDKRHGHWYCWSKSRSNGLNMVGHRSGLDNFLNRNTHVTAIAAFTAIPFIFAHASLGANTSIPAPSARALTVATLFTLAAALAPRLGRQIFLIGCQLMLKLDRRARSFARIWRVDHIVRRQHFMAPSGDYCGGFWLAGCRRGAAPVAFGRV
jgi:hypothetical protein